MLKKANLIINPIAGKNRDFDYVALLRKTLSKAGYELEVFETAKKGQAEAFASSEECKDSLLIAAGGDGTVSEVVKGMDFNSSDLAIMPLGTANVFAKELGISPDLKSAVGHLASGNLRYWDVGLANDERFVVFLGTPFDAAVTGTLSRNRKGNITYLSYVIPTLKVYARWKSPPIKVTMDGKPLDGFASQVIISNVDHFARFFSLSPQVRPDDGLLDVFVFRKRGRLALLIYSIGMFLGILPSFKSVEHHKAKDVILESEEEDVPYQLDGDLRGNLPLKISVLPRALRLIV